jgi:hypothetical protein
VGEMKILCVILSLPKDLMFESIKSVIEQTIPVEMVVLLTKKSNKPTQTEQVPDILTDAYEKIDLTTFDYILKIDRHVVLPKDFLERNLANEPDTIVSAGYQIIKVKPFLERAKMEK